MILLKKVKTIWRPGFDELQEMAALQPFQIPRDGLSSGDDKSVNQHVMEPRAGPGSGRRTRSGPLVESIRPWEKCFRLFLTYLRLMFTWVLRPERKKIYHGDGKAHTAPSLLYGDTSSKETRTHCWIINSGTRLPGQGPAYQWASTLQWSLLLDQDKAGT